MTGSVGYNIYLDRDGEAFEAQIDYYIEGYSDPETDEYFGDTSWNVSITPLDGGGGGGGTGGWAAESDSAYIGLPLSYDPAIRHFRLEFNAYNTFSGDSVSYQANILISAYASARLVLTGTDGVDWLISGSAGDVLRGRDGNDYLDGGEGGDRLIGGAGDDSLVGGLDGDELRGGQGNDTLVGGEGGDRMEGGDGTDLYYVDDANDLVIEQDGKGIDKIYAFTDYRLPDFVENLQLGGLTDEGAGNRLANRIDGNSRSNILDGAGGNDTLFGLAGDDTLLGGGGADRLDGGLGQDDMRGGRGNDSYVLVGSETVYELPGEGTDTLEILAGYTSFRLTAALGEIENILCRGSANFDATGNALDNWIITGSGDDRIAGKGGDDRLEGGAGDDRLIGGDGNDTLIGGAGIDLADYREVTGALVINLRTGGGDGSGGVDVLREIENIAAGAGDDTLTGSAAANVMTGGLGNDAIDGRGGDDLVEGGAGADSLTGGSGVDSLSYRHSAEAVTVDLAAGVASGGDAEDDSISGFENVIGGAGADSLTGNALDNLLTGGEGDDTLTGGAGDDLLRGGRGADQLDGGEGSDTVSFADLTGAVAVDLAVSSISGGGGDAISGFENAEGGSGADQLFGDDGTNVLVGGAGADTIDGRGGDDVVIGGAGADSLDGGEGFDILSYRGSASSVVVDLLYDYANGGDAAGDQFSGFEKLVGSSFHDSLFGTDESDRIAGGAGYDYIEGRGGDDTVAGGSDSDYFRFETGSGHDVVLDFETGYWGDALSMGFGSGYDTIEEVLSAGIFEENRVTFTFGGDSIVLVGHFAPEDFVAENFDFYG